ncbi:uncharacterized protein DSM5745_05579 [Aspergillus mulundensis]|uniref:Major facilitator superfamily (MFS) profile domain-containing protein n=1 Tax=Aspergillus mulundensis TaxID=1810919 RepID=A0A3D8RXD9_9EURO|nr:Uncharacterized protein DSM5745_05579 [Aspergillus mulundensis]RDW78727.1 Uncharacterized protein DSM5745_05579 [Aspergillus mulundensis]
MPSQNTDAMAELETLTSVSSRQEQKDGNANARRRLGYPETLCSLSTEERNKLERQLVRKLDARLMAPLIIMYIMNYLDRNAIAAAKIAGIVDDLNLSDSEFQTCISILFVGYILMQIPSNLYLTKIGKPSIYLPLCMAIWGSLCAVTGAVHNFSGLAATRFLLGFVEAAHHFESRRASHLRGTESLRSETKCCSALGLEAWRWIFIIEGAITVAIATTVTFILPDFPTNTKWMTDQERALASWRPIADIGEEDWVSPEEEGLAAGFQQCIRDYKTWLFAILIFAVVSSGTINSYFPTIVETLNYSRTTTLLFTAPPYLLSCIVTLCVSFNADRTGERYFHFTLPTWISVAGFIISGSTTNFPARYISMMIMLPGVYTAFTIGLTWLANALPRPPAKRAAALALCSAASNCSSIYGAFLYPQSTAPRYIMAMGINASTAVMSIIVANFLHFDLKRLNRKLDEAELEAEAEQVGGMGAQTEGTVQSNFRYLY